MKTPAQTKASEIKGEKIIFDLSIKGNLRHVIVVKEADNFHINLDGEDLGYFHRLADGTTQRFTQPKGAETDVDAYFEAIENRLKELSDD